MITLTEQSLKTCDKDSLALSTIEIEKHLRELNGWTLNYQQDSQKIIKNYKFKDFRSAMKFANMVTDLAEEENHHPCICIEWGTVNLSWWTHSLSGLFINDFIMAARCDKAYQ
ncbi:MAG: 4a-hydroxytetrahydrobiopterin dehydratase [endosymbiont of Galathealinum brachiosum]|uniref:Putative pterin-4-alpha-carbinolamine dehydratase n=1 Tax=endosymbiont of Galathealinum brachiosum TaxID=2200906 RepID=A0A370DDW7_9GAMM|nr:MAG: 4a-hydroxytetrahydrobiopterin dehydratase [endosymbiont of Galathealinum brachiosum]